LTFGQMMLCLTAQMKKSNSYELDFLVEAAGVEPASENLLIQLSPGAVYLL